MSFPHINIKTKNFDVTDPIYEVLVKRLSSLERLLPKGEVVCDVELEKTTEGHTGKIYRAEVNIASGKNVMHVEALEERMEAAIDRAKSEMKRVLEKTHSRSESLFRRGARRAKELFRFREQQ